MLSVPQDVGEPAPSAPATPDPDKAPPAQSATDELSYYQRLQGDNAPAEALKTEKESASARTPTPAAEQVPPSATTAPPAGDTAKPAAEPPRAAAAPPPTATKPEPAAPPQKTVPAAAKNVAAKPATPAASEPAGDGFVVQVASVRERSEADAILKHLQGKGYSAFVLAPGPGSPVSTFRVRVGKFKARSEAEKMAQRLEKEEQYKPWVTR
jgi:cell division protein FtsN